MRAGRLMALVLLLQERGAMTADEAAGALEVSVRTVYRDVSALQQAGVPLWTATGPGGGIRLVEGWRTTLDGITADEAGALFLPGAPGTAAELGLGSLLAAAEVKVRATMPEGARRSADQVRQRFLLDAPGWFHRVEEVPALPVLADALWRDRRVDLRYRRGERPVERRIDPLGLVLKAGTWYLVASHRGRVLSYRVSRVERAAIRAEPTRRPPGFDLAPWWASSQEDFGRSLLRARVRLRLSAAARRRLRELVDPAAAAEALAEAGEPDARGWQELDLAVESVEVAAGQLVALGDGIEALDPPALRDALARVGRALLDHNRPRSPERTPAGRSAGGRAARGPDGACGSN